MELNHNQNCYKNQSCFIHIFGINRQSQNPLFNKEWTKVNFTEKL